MTSNSLILKKIKEMNFSKLNAIAKKIAEKNNKSVLYVKFDMLINFFKYGIGYTDYLKSDYINLNKEEKKSFFTTKNYFNIIGYLNDRKYRIIFQDKIIFNKMFKKYIKREFIDLRIVKQQGLLEFLKGKETAFAKAVDDFGGHNMSKIIIKNEPDIEKLYNRLIKAKQFLIEETIIQHKELERLNPYAVNSFRIVTLINDGKAYVLNNALRINIDKEVSIGCSDAYMKLNEDGTLASPVVDDLANVYEKHPLTGEDLTTVNIPYVKEAFEMVKEAALVVPQIRYVGWDVTFTEKGPIIVEGNEYPSYGLTQYYLLGTGKKGNLGQIEDVLGEKIKV